MPSYPEFEYLNQCKHHEAWELRQPDTDWYVCVGNSVKQ